ncbi:hypothetical protein U1Q18_008384 [Sarracenia purpurea var. burkii]
MAWAIHTHTVPCQLSSITLLRVSTSYWPSHLPPTTTTNPNPRVKHDPKRDVAFIIDGPKSHPRTFSRLLQTPIYLFFLCVLITLAQLATLLYCQCLLLKCVFW